jgi:phosphatidylglycerol lysyltransferase
VGALTAADGERARMLDLVERRGTSPLSFLLRYEVPWRAHFVGDAAVCYLEGRRAAVAWSDPLCDAADLAPVVVDFAEAMRAQGRGVCLVAIAAETARAALGAGFSVLKVGEEPWFDLGAWERPRGDRGKKLRWLVNRARREGVEVGDHEPGRARDPSLVEDVEAVPGRWRAALGRPESNSFMRTAPLALPGLKRLFVARHRGVAEAVLACAYLPASGNWYFEDLVRAPDAVNGATELLVAEALDRLRADGAPAAAFALAPMRGMREQIDPRARRLAWVLAGAIRGLDRRYGFRAIARYEARFEPTEWRPRFVAFRPALPRPAVIRAAVQALG